LKLLDKGQSSGLEPGLSTGDAQQNFSKHSYKSIRRTMAGCDIWKVSDMLAKLYQQEEENVAQYQDMGIFKISREFWLQYL
jgi:hypothetical protein